MPVHLIARLGLVAVVAVVAFLTAWQGSGPVWGTVSAVAVGGGVAVAIFHHGRRRPRRG